jgi:hypothetical protein
MKRLLLITFISTIFNVSAQQLITVKGNVVSADGDKSLQIKKGEPIIGAPIKIKGAGRGTITDIDGNFKLRNVEVGTVLEISYSGFNAYEIKIIDTTFIKIKMKVSLYNNEDFMALCCFCCSRNNDYLNVDNSFSKSSTKEDLIKTCKANEPVPLNYFKTNSSEVIFEDFYKKTDKKPVSSFALNVANKSYVESKRHFKNDNKPPKDLVRIEEFINHFSYQFPKVKDENAFSIYSEYAECPWNRGNKLLLVNLEAKTEANDAKIQLEFNPSKVKYYRLIGYENRVGNCENFNSELKDGSDLLPGHAVTTIYEIEPANRKFNPKVKTDSLRYQSNMSFENINELANIKFNYTDPKSDQRNQIEKIVYNYPIDFEKASESMRFAVAVAEFAMLLKETGFIENASYNQVIELAESAKGTDESGERSEFIRYAKLLLSSPYYGLK